MVPCRVSSPMHALQLTSNVSLKSLLLPTLATACVLTSRTRWEELNLICKGHLLRQCNINVAGPDAQNVFVAQVYSPAMALCQWHHLA